MILENCAEKLKPRLWGELFGIIEEPTFLQSPKKNLHWWYDFMSPVQIYLAVLAIDTGNYFSKLCLTAKEIKLRDTS